LNFGDLKILFLCIRTGGISCGSKTQVMGHCFTDTVTTLTPFLMLTLGLSATIRQCFRPKRYTKTIFRLKISISKGLGCSSIDKTITRDLRFRPTMEFLIMEAVLKHPEKILTTS